MGIVRSLRRHRRMAWLVVAALAGAALLFAVPGMTDAMAATVGGDRESVRDALLGLGAFAPIASLGLNVLQGVLAPVPGFVVPYVNGMVFGTVWGALLSWVGGIAAATACFAIARRFGQRVADRVCNRHATLERANRLVERNGLWTVVVARLAPGMPFDAFSYLGGLTRIRPATFILGTAIGSAPHAYLYALLGEHLDLPLWLGVAVMPLAGVALGGVHLLVSRRRGPFVTAPEPSAA